MNLLDTLKRRPLSSLTYFIAISLFIYPIYQQFVGNVYIESLDYVDGTTLIMVGLILLRGITSQRFDSDLQAVSIALIGALSFIFTFEAIFKLSFYAFPWRMPPEELREFVIQVGVALTALVGFAFDKFRLSNLSRTLAGIFIAGWCIWLLIGFPQLNDGQNFYPAVINIDLNWDGIYTLNRVIKIVLFLFYLSIFRGQIKERRSGLMTI
jgi:hypothetical protein